MESLQVKEYMNHYPVTFAPEMVVEEAALRFLKTKQIGGPVIDKNNQRVHLNTVKNEDLKYIGNYLGTINKNHHGTGVDHSSNKKHNLVSSSLSTINHGRYSKRQRF